MRTASFSAIRVSVIRVSPPLFPSTPFPVLVPAPCWAYTKRSAENSCELQSDTLVSLNEDGDRNYTKAEGYRAN